MKHVPHLGYRILSVSAITRRGEKITFDEVGVEIRSNTEGTLFAQGTLRCGLYRLDMAIVTTARREVMMLTAQSVDLWHQRLGRVCTQGIQQMANQGVVDGLSISEASANHQCRGCILGKSFRTAIPKSRSSRATKLLELVHTDVLGPLEVCSVGGSRYVITFIDDYSHWTVTYTMKLLCFKRYKAMAEKHTSQKLQKLLAHEYMSREEVSGDELKLKVLRSDNGGGHLSNDFKKFLAENGINHELTVAYTPQQNGVAERMNRTLLDLTRAMLHH